MQLLFRAETLFGPPKLGETSLEMLNTDDTSLEVEIIGESAQAPCCSSEVSAIEKEFLDAAIQQSMVTEEDMISEEEVKAVMVTN